MRRAWLALDRAATDAGAEALAPEVWECVLPATGEVVSIVRTEAEAHHVARESEAWTLAEIAVLIERLGNQVRQVKRTFPGSAVVEVRDRDPPPIDWEKGDDPPFEQGSGWRRRAWQDPAAIPATITHEGTIMAALSLRVQRSEARAIRAPVSTCRSGAQR
jgi:hypothetical protein